MICLVNVKPARLGHAKAHTLYGVVGYKARSRRPLSAPRMLHFQHNWKAFFNFPLFVKSSLYNSLYTGGASQRRVSHDQRVNSELTQPTLQLHHSSPSTSTIVHLRDT